MVFNIVIPLAGANSRFSNYGFTMSKYMLPINTSNVSLIEHILLSFDISIEICFIFILRTNDLSFNNLKSLLFDICHKHNFAFKIFDVLQLTSGTASTVNSISSYISDNPLFITNSNIISQFNFKKFYNHCISLDTCSIFNYSTNDYIGFQYYKTGNIFCHGYNHIVNCAIQPSNNEYTIQSVYDSLHCLNYDAQDYSFEYNESVVMIETPQQFFAYYNIENHIKIYSIADFNLFIKSYYNFIPIQFLLIQPHDVINIYNGLLFFLSGTFVNKYGNHSFPKIITSGNNLDLLSLVCSSVLVINISINIDYTNIVPSSFNSNMFKFNNFQIKLLQYTNGDKIKFEYHRTSTIIHIITSGKILINDVIINTSEFYLYEPNHLYCPVIIEDCSIICIYT